MGFRALGYHEKKAGLTLPSLSAELEAPAAIALLSSDPPPLPRVFLYHPSSTIENPKLAVVSGLPLDSPALLSNLPQTMASSNQLLDANVTTMPELSLAPFLPRRPLSPFSPRLSFDFSRFWELNDEKEEDAENGSDFLSHQHFTETKRQLPLTSEADERVLEDLGDNDLMPHVYRILIEGMSQSSLHPLSALSNRHQLCFGPSVQVATTALREFDFYHPNMLSLAINCAALYQDDLLLAQIDASVPEWGRMAKSHQGRYHCPVAHDSINYFRHMLFATRHKDTEVHFTVGVNCFISGQRISRVTLVVHGDLMIAGFEI